MFGSENEQNTLKVADEVKALDTVTKGTVRNLYLVDKVKYFSAIRRFHGKKGEWSCARRTEPHKKLERRFSIPIFAQCDVIYVQ